ncbi:MAG: Gfo/Idh/MocA family oxidoreductase [Victivallales bacterium]|nr:Gfo/Idh/MocA family oxidoreductase [Victivallales bacterium]
MSEKTPIKVGIWGLGRAGFGMHTKELQKYNDEFTVVAACDIDPARFDKLHERFPDAATYTDGEAFLADPSVELVSVAVRSPQHVDYAIRALEKGKLVFLEKPIALTTLGTAKLAEAIKAHPGKLYFRHNRRFELLFNQALDFMHSGKLGDVFEIRMARHGFGFREDWQAIIDCGGGQLNNWGPHVIDQAVQMLESPVKSVWSDLKRIHGRGDAEDHVKVILKGENGRIVDLEISDSVAIGAPVTEIYGSRGTLRSEADGIHVKYMKPEQEMPTYGAKRESPPLSAGFGGGFVAEFIDEVIPYEKERITEFDIYHKLYEAIREGQPFRVKPEEAFENVRVAEIVRKQNPDFPQWLDEFGK